jgi:hypothetical protein
MVAKVPAAALLLLAGLGADGSDLRSAVSCGEFTRRSVCAPNRTVPGQRKALLQHCTLSQCTGACETQAQNGCCEFDSFGGGACAWVLWGVETPGKPSHSAAVCSGGPPPLPPPPPPPPPGPPTATTSCVGCWNKASGQCQINPMAGSCTFAQPSDCAAIPVRLRNSASQIFLSSHTCVYTYGIVGSSRPMAAIGYGPTRACGAGAMVVCHASAPSTAIWSPSFPARMTARMTGMGSTCLGRAPRAPCRITRPHPRPVSQRVSKQVPHTHIGPAWFFLSLHSAYDRVAVAAAAVTWICRE